MYIVWLEDLILQRYFVNPEQIQENAVRLTGEDAFHAIKVMRARTGDRFVACDGSGGAMLAAITDIRKDEVVAEVLNEPVASRETAVELWVFQGLPKGDKLETVIQKSTELGAWRIVPFQSSRTVVQLDDRKEGRKLERWRKIAKEAAEQAHRSRVPSIEVPISWKQLLQEAARADLALFCYENGEGGLRTVLRGADWSQVKRAAVVVGPEGGFSEQEAAEAEQAGLRLVSLGARILRTETAALAALACMAYEAGEMGGE